MSFLLDALSSNVLGIFANVAGTKLTAENDAMNAEERARTDRFNAIVAEQEAKSEMEGTRADASDFRRAQSARLAASRARQAGSGFALAGSPMLINEASLAEVEFGVSRIIHAGLLKENRLKTQALLLNRSASVEDRNAKFSRQAGTIGAIGGIASGVASAIKFG